MQETPEKKVYNNYLFIYLGTAEDKAIVLSSQRMKQLEELIDSITKEELSQVKGVIFTSPPQLAFCVGADLKAIKSVTEPAIGKELAKQGQRIFFKIEKLPIPTYAAIQGHCVGGGCELALACTHRVIANDTKSRIGLPETKLGILPGFGGTQRLPRLIGLPKAIDFITNAKVISGKQAKKLGLVDGYINLQNERITPDTIIEACEAVAKKTRSLSFPDNILTNTAIGRYLVSKKSHTLALKKTKGKYPAIPASITSCINAFKLSPSDAYEKEAEYLGSLIASPESKSLVHLFYLTEFSSKIGKKSGIKNNISKVGVIGAGVMGKGIAAVAVKNKLHVKISDPIEDSLKKATEHVEAFLSQSKSLSDSDKKSLMQNLVTVQHNSELSDCDMVIEAAVENIDVKKKIFASLEEKASADTIIATNTSSLTLQSIFGELKNQENCLGVHFFNPVEKMPLIEIVRSKKSSDHAIVSACAFASSLGKYPVVVEDVPGFLVNRILAPYLAEASQLLLEGASFESVEKTVTNYGFPMGPFRLLDEVGIDIALKVQEVLTAGYGNRMKGAHYLEVLYKKNLLGKKNGAGFYLHTKEETTPHESILNELQISRNLSSSKISQKEIEERLLCVMTLEALRAYEEEVAGSPSDEAMGQIDLSSVMGFGFPPFKGGILYNSKIIGWEILLKWANVYNSKGERYHVPKILNAV